MNKNSLLYTQALKILKTQAVTTIGLIIRKNIWYRISKYAYDHFKCDSIWVRLVWGRGSHTCEYSAKVIANHMLYDNSIELLFGLLLTLVPKLATELAIQN